MIDGAKVRSLRDPSYTGVVVAAGKVQSLVRWTSHASVVLFHPTADLLDLTPVTLRAVK